MTTLEHAVTHIMSPERYAVTPHTTPYEYTYEAPSSLRFVGTRHSTIVEDPQWHHIETAIEQHKPDIILVEGVQSLQGPAEIERLIARSSDVTAIERGGESVFGIKKALDTKTAWGCPEPEDDALYSHLIQNYFSPEEIAAWHMLRLFPQYARRDESINFATYTIPFVAQFKEATGWKDFDYTHARAIALAREVLGRELPIHNTERMSELTDPIPWPQRWEEQTIFNEMSRTTLAFRDQAIVATVVNELNAGKRVLVIYGAGHAVMQEPAYRFLRQQTL